MFAPSCLAAIGIEHKNRQDLVYFFTPSGAVDSSIAFFALAIGSQAEKSRGHLCTLFNENRLQHITRSDLLQRKFTHQ
jgi:hypothetical protein